MYHRQSSLTVGIALKKRYPRLLADLSLRDGLAEAITSASAEGLGKTAKALLADKVPALLEAAADEVIKAIAGPIIGPLFKALLNASDKVASRLDQMMREPFATGIDTALHALQ